jgi:protocatechuate 3,4-dioxygenase beta subunit
LERLFRGRHATAAPMTPAHLEIEPLEMRQLLTAYYVSPLGSDSSAGTSTSAPWKSITKVNQINFKAGDQIYFKGGSTFNGTISFDANDKGTSSAPIKVSSYGGGKAIINAGGGNGLYAHNTAGFDISNMRFTTAGRLNNSGAGVYFVNDLNTNTKLQYVHIDDIDAGDFGNSGIYISGLLLNGSTAHNGYNDIRITNSALHDNTMFGIRINGNGNDAHTNLYVGSVRLYNNVGRGDQARTNGNGIMVGNVTNGTVERSVAYSNGGNGNHCVGMWMINSTNVVFQYNESYSNRTSFDSDGGGFDIDGGCQNCTIQYNYSHDNYGAGYGIFQYIDAAPFNNNVVRYNISQNDGRHNSYNGIRLWSPQAGGLKNVEIYNNTVYMTKPASGNPRALFIKTPTTNVHIRNNIFVTTGGLALAEIASGQSGLLMQNNNYYASGSTLNIIYGSTTYTSMSAFRSGTGQETVNGQSVGTSADPKFVSAGGGGTVGIGNSLASNLSAYKLTSGSPMINAGLDLKTKFGVSVGSHDFYGQSIPYGGAFDIGANEAGSSPPSGGGTGGGGGGTTGGSIAGAVFNDANNNAVRDSGEVGLSGITLYNDANNNYVMESSEIRTTTDSSGNYQFSGLSAATYKIRQILPSGWGQTTPANGFGHTVTLATDQASTGQDFGASQSTAPTPPPPTGASIAGEVFNDANSNAVLDPGEAGVANITIYNDADNDHIMDPSEIRTTTDSSGNYKFSGLAAGTYKIRQILQSGWGQTTPANGFGHTVTLTSTQQEVGRNFGTVEGGTTPAEQTGGSIAGRVFNDANGNGTLDSGEAGVANITVYNDADNDYIMDPGELRTTTNSSGDYLFSGLASGNYKIRQILQSGWSQTTPSKGYGHTIALATDQNVSGRNFGTVQGGTTPASQTGGSIAGRVFNDANGNGILDSGEAGIGGITIYNDADNDYIMDASELRTTTNSNGDYFFGSLSSGNYKIRQILQSGWSQTTPSRGYGHTITLATNQSVSAKNFGTKQIA